MKCPRPNNNIPDEYKGIVWIIAILLTVGYFISLTKGCIHCNIC